MAVGPSYTACATPPGTLRLTTACQSGPNAPVNQVSVASAICPLANSPIDCPMADINAWVEADDSGNIRGGSSSAKECTRGAKALANCNATFAPNECPTTCACAISSASISDAQSAACCSIDS